MADSTIGSLPRADGVGDAALFVLEQGGQAMSATGAQWRQFAENCAAVPAAQAAASAAAAAGSASAAAESARSAASDAAQARAYGGNPPRPMNGTWWLWDAAGERYVDSGAKSVLSVVRSYATYALMEADAANRAEGDLVVISADSGDAAAGSLYVKSGTGWAYLTSLVGMEGPAGPAGPAGAAGPNEITAATATDFSGLLKGASGHAAAAEPGVDYLAPVSGTPGHVAVIGQGGVLADGGAAIADLGGGGNGNAERTLILIPPGDTARYCTTQTWALDPAFPLSDYRLLELEARWAGSIPQDMTIRVFGTQTTGTGAFAMTIPAGSYTGRQSLLFTKSTGEYAYNVCTTAYVNLSGGNFPFTTYEVRHGAGLANQTELRQVTVAGGGALYGLILTLRGIV